MGLRPSTSDLASWQGGQPHENSIFVNRSNALFFLLCRLSTGQTITSQKQFPVSRWSTTWSAPQISRFVYQCTVNHTIEHLSIFIDHILYSVFTYLTLSLFVWKMVLKHPRLQILTKKKCKNERQTNFTFWIECKKMYFTSYPCDTIIRNEGSPCPRTGKHRQQQKYCQQF